jgi:Type I restriction enzyme R protein N terminus (HSDR_N)
MQIDHEGLVLKTEADVEQKVIMPLLAGEPLLAIPQERIFTKDYLAPAPLDKAAGRTGGYYPDYSVWLRALPVAIIEAKAPEVPSEVGYREASLYARHLNQKYPTNVNPCRFIFASNGKMLLFGYWDSEPALTISVSNLRIGTADLVRLQELATFSVLDEHALDCLRKLRTQKSIRPFSLAGGTAILNAKKPLNTFAADLSPILRRYFSSTNQENIREIAERAYVSSAEITEYDRVLEALLKDRTGVHRDTVVQRLEPGRHSEAHVSRGRVAKLVGKADGVISCS